MVDQMVERPIVSEFHAGGPGFLGLDRAVGRLGDKTRLGVEPFDLAPDIRLQGFAALDKQ